jgi:predicted ArsR family transcriptional regulator
MVSDSKLLEVIEGSQDRWDRPFVTAKQVSEVIGMTRQGTHRRLEQLHEKGEIRKYKPGRSAIWWSESVTTGAAD